MPAAGTIERDDDSTKVALSTVEEHSQLVTFFNIVRAYETRARDQGLTVHYHLFWQDGGKWFPAGEKSQALCAYLRKRSEGIENIRLMLELTDDRETTLYEADLLAYGIFLA